MPPVSKFYNYMTDDKQTKINNALPNKKTKFKAKFTV